MFVDPSRVLTEFQKARLEWYAAMDLSNQQWLAEKREENRQELERRTKLATPTPV